MCRFLMIKSETPISPFPLLEEFASLARNSKALNGDWQGDGWGVSWLSEDRGWQSRKSILPIWEEPGSYSDIPESRFVLVHARSSSFKEQVGEIAFNQPFLEGDYAFVFNGFIQGVSLPIPANGRIGSQKIWNLLAGMLERSAPAVSLLSLKELLLENCRHVQALNIGLCDSSRIFAFSHYTENPGYYTLHAHSSTCLWMISSEPLGGYRFSPIPPGRIVEF